MKISIVESTKQLNSDQKAVNLYYNSVISKVEQLKLEAAKHNKELLILAVKPEQHSTPQSTLVTFLLHLIAEHLELGKVLLKDKDISNTQNKTASIGNLTNLTDIKTLSALQQETQNFKTILEQETIYSQIYHYLWTNLPKLLYQSFIILSESDASLESPANFTAIVTKTHKILNLLLSTHHTDIVDQVTLIIQKMCGADDETIGSVRSLFDNKIGKYTSKVIEKQYLNATQEARDFIAEKDESGIVFCNVAHIKSILEDETLQQKYHIVVISTDEKEHIPTTQESENIILQALEIFKTESISLIEEKMKLEMPYIFYGIKGSVVITKMLVNAWTHYKESDTIKTSTTEVKPVLDDHNVTDTSSVSIAPELLGVEYTESELSKE